MPNAWDQKVSATTTLVGDCWVLVLVLVLGAGAG
jgi:hypothetical protein